MNRSWFFALSLTLATELAAQTPAPPPLQSQEPIFKGPIDVVTRDVIVRDRKGLFVPDLTADEFEVYDDGVQQDIISMTVVSGGRATRVFAPPPSQNDSIFPMSQPMSDISGRMFLFFVDDLHMDFHGRDGIPDLFKKLAKNLLHDGDVWGMVSSGFLSNAIDMTPDKNRFDEAVEQMAANPSSPTDVIQAPYGTEGPSEVRYRAHVAFSTVADALRALENVHDRRKVLVYVSEGYDVNSLQVRRFGTKDSNASFQQGEEFPDEDLARELHDVTRTANCANTRLYPIDPRGFVRTPDTSQYLDPTRGQDYVRRSQDTLRVLAEETGGVTVVTQSDLDKALKQIDGDASDYYVIGFYSGNRDDSKCGHQVEVKVTRKAATGEDLNVWSR